MLTAALYKPLQIVPRAKPLQKQIKRFLQIDTYGVRTSNTDVVCSVFGGSGALGRFVVNKLCAVGIQMVVPFRGEIYNSKHLKVMGEIGQVVPQKFDIRDPDSIYDSLKHSNLVVNLISQNNPSRNFSLESINIDGPRLIAQIAREAAVERFIHISCVPYDPNSKSEWIRTKSIGEDEVRKAFPSATILRPGPLFGIDDQLLTRPAQMLRWLPIFPVYRGNRIIQPVYYDDVARAVLEAAANDQTQGKIYEVVGNEIWSQNSIYQYLSHILYHEPWFVENPITDKLIEMYAEFAYMTQRAPRYSPASLDVMKYDAIKSPESLGFEDLGIPPEELQSMERFAINAVRMYRRAHRYDGNILDSWVHPPTYKATSQSTLAPLETERIKKNFRK